MARSRGLPQTTVIACLVLCVAATAVHSIEPDAAASGVAGRRGLRQTYPPALTHAEHAHAFAQKRILLETKEQLAGGEAGMQLLEDWTDDNNMCRWYGIVCDEYDEWGNYIAEGPITGIDMTEQVINGLEPDLILTGELPPSWASLTTFTSITFRVRAEFQGSLPSSWSSLVNLVALEVVAPWYRNDGERVIGGLSGPLPTSWGPKLKNLVQLTLQFQQISGPLPASWGSMKKLTDVDLLGNNITGQLPVAWSGMTSLETLDVSGNQLKGPIPATWAKLSKVARLELADNQFSGAVPKWLTSMPGLWVLYLSTNKFSGALPADIFTKTELVVFSAYNNPALAGCIPKQMKTRKGFALYVYNTPAYDDYSGAEKFPLATYSLVRNKGPLQGTKITGLCA